MTEATDEFLTLPEATARLGLNLDVARRKVRKGVLDGLLVCIADRRFIRSADLPRVRELLAPKKGR